MGVAFHGPRAAEDAVRDPGQEAFQAAVARGEPAVGGVQVMHHGGDSRPPGGGARQHAGEVSVGVDHVGPRRLEGARGAQHVPGVVAPQAQHAHRGPF